MDEQPNDEPAPSPWARPVPGAASPAPMAEVWPAQVTPASEPARRRWPLVVGALAVVAIIVAGLAAIAGGGGDDDDEPAAAPSSSSEPSSTTSTAPSTIVASTNPPSTSSEPPGTASPTSIAEDPTVPPTIGPTDVEPGTYSLAMASETQAPTAQRFVNTTSVAGLETTISGAMDDQQRFEMSFGVGGASGGLEIVLDVPGGMAYYSGGQFDAMITGDATWIGIDLAAAMEASGQSLDGLRENLNGAGVSKALVDRNPTPLGLTVIEGESVMLYEVGLDSEQFAEAIAGNPQFAAGGVTADMLSTIDSVTYALYVTESNALRRLVATIAIDGGEITTTYDTFPVEPGFVVQVPALDTVQIVDPSELG